MGLGGVQVEQKLEDEYGPDLVEVVGVMLGSSTAVACGPQPARRS